MNKAIFLDRDGTINVEKNYLYKIEDFEFMPGVVDALKQLQQAGYLLIIVTNQSGIARGYYTEKDFQKLNDWMVTQLKMQDVIIDQVYFCPHLPNAEVEKYRKDCNCRKPKLGLYQQAIADYKIELKKSYAIGDKIRDCAICEQTLCKGFLVGDNEKPDIIDKVKDGAYDRVSYANSLADAANMILQMV
jgi:D-glycero-D-manno-heptose 1,7-bisphosphate phosphatase